MVEGWLLTTVAIEQLSATVGKPRETPVALHPLLLLTILFAGQVIVGNTLSCTVTICVHVAVLFAASFTVQVTVVLPNGNAAGALFVTTNAAPLEQLSATVGVPNTTPVAVQPVFVNAVTFAGHVIVGTVLSVTVTVNEQVEELDGVAASVAV